MFAFATNSDNFGRQRRSELSMGRLDQARTRKCKPEPGPNLKVI